MKLAYASIALVTIVGCSSPTAPTLEQQVISTTKEGTQPTPPVAEDPLFEPIPTVGSIVVNGPSGCFQMANQGEILEWTITNVPLDAKIDKGYAHDDAPGCGATLGSLRTQNDHLRWERTGTTIVVHFDRNTYDCGRAQVDLSINGQVFIGVVANYGERCVPIVEPPVVIVPPTVELPPLIPPMTDCRKGVKVVDLKEISGRAVAFVIIREGYSVDLTLRSFTKVGTGLLPQNLYDGIKGTFSSGSHTISVGLPPSPTRYQADLFCGLWPDEGLNEGNFPGYDGALLKAIWRN